MKLVLALIALLGVVAVHPPGTNASNILAIFPLVSKSHFKVGEALVLGLAEAGHKVTLITAYDYKPKLANVKVLQLTGAIEIAEEHAKRFVRIEQFAFAAPLIIPAVIMQGQIISNFTLNHPTVRALMNDRPAFDVIVAEQFCTESLFGFGQHFDAPVIAVSTFGASKLTNDLVGTPSPPSYVAHAFSVYSDRMSFWQRSVNMLLTIFENVLMEVMHHPAQRGLYEAAFGGADPASLLSYDEMRKSVSLVLLNMHHSISSPRPYVPNMIEVGGMHVNRKVSELPKIIKDFMDSATNGVIYFSFGSFMKSSMMSAEQRDTFIRVFSSLPQKVIWKFEEKFDMPANVLIDSWLPQDDILSHPNMRLFITHGGLLGTTESVYHGVPVLGMPFFGDQQRNVAGATKAGWGLQLDYANVTDESLRWAINEIIGNAKYLANARQVSLRYRDQPATPLETAVWWTEYVIRHRGAGHLRSAGLDLNFLQYHNIDVAVMFVVVGLLGTFFACVLTRKCCRRVCGGRRKKTTSCEKKKN